MKKLMLLMLSVCYTLVFAQSSDCNTATPIALNGGTTCVNGSTSGALTVNYTTHACYNLNQDIYVVYYTFVADNPNFSIEVNGSGGNPAAQVGISMSTSDCAANLIDDCVYNGTSSAIMNTGFSVGEVVTLAITTNTAPGDFELCITSSAASNGDGNVCGNPIVLCNKDDVEVSSMTNNDASGFTPSCFLLSTNRDIYFEFTCTQSGTLAWIATPAGNEPTEFDWAVYEMTGPASCSYNAEIACNYNYTSQANEPFGMQTGGLGELFGSEIDPTINITAGNTYIIYIDNFSNTGNEGFTLDFLDEMTAEIGPIVDFTINPNTPVCGTDAVVNFTNNSSLTGTHTWDFGNGNNFVGTAPSGQTYSGAGTYPVTLVVDDGNCAESHTEFVQVFDDLLVAETVQNVTCEGGNDGSISLNVSGGEGIYDFVWNPNVGTGNSATGLSAGNYQVTVTDATCGDQVLDIAVGFDNPLPTLVIDPVTPLCETDAAITLNATPNGGLFTGTGVNAGDFDPAVAGVNTHTINYDYTDGFGCSNSTSIDIQVIVCCTGADLTVNDADVCDDGVAAVDLTTLASSTSGAIITFHSSQADADNDINALGNTLVSNGTYYVRAEDPSDNTCFSTGVITVNLLALPVINAPGDYAICDGDNTTLTANNPGGATISWDNGVTDGVAFTPGSTLEYKVIADDGFCTNADSVVVTVNPIPMIDAGADQLVCAGTMVTLTGTNPDGAVLTWDNGVTDGSPFQANDTVVYSLNATLNGCDAVPSQVTVFASDAPIVTISNVVAPSCDNNDGAFTVNITGTPTFEIIVNGTSYITGAGNTQLVDALAAGNYSIEANDGNCPSNVESVSLVLPPSPQGTLDITDENCTALNGIIVVNMNTGTAPYSYSLNGGVASGSNTFPYLSTGSYDVTVTDANNCVVVISGNVGNINDINADFDLTTYEGEAPLNVGFINNSSNANNFVWNLGNGDVSNLETPSDVVYTEGVYTITLTVTNAFGCVDSIAQTLYVYEGFEIEIPNVFTPNNDGSNDLFYINSSGASELNCIVYNRWGNKIAEFDGLTEGWNGKNFQGVDVTDQVYFYLISAKDATGKEYQYNGNVTILR